jgi:hypothetical protein
LGQKKKSQKATNKHALFYTLYQAGFILYTRIYTPNILVCTIIFIFSRAETIQQHVEDLSPGFNSSSGERPAEESQRTTIGW